MHIIDKIPTDATVDNYDEKRFCMIAGQIKSKDGSPLGGVQVSIHAHPEYGTTLTDANGSYAIPAEGGLKLIMRYAKQGYTTTDRSIQAPVQDWVRSPDVTMLTLDTKVTSINLGNSTPKIHISTPISDAKGERSTTLVFDGVTKATVTSVDGSTRELTNLSVRATEFETPKSMPSDLPTESAYTYCSDLTVDGVGDDEEVSFDAPVIMYVDNFLGFDVGEIVPVGYYDRKAGAWKASDNGVVVKLLDTDGDGKVDALDSTGDDAPNDLNGDGSTSDEVSGIADNSNYTAGKTYWRAAITHFTPWDHNWPYGPPEDSEDPDTPDTDDDDTPPNDCQADISSYVTKKSRVFHEDIPVAGTDITLHYSSKRVDGYDYVIDTKVDTTSAPASTLSAVATLEVGGKIFTRALELGEVNQLSFVWDGKDVLGNGMNGEVTAVMTVKYIYNLVYYRASSAFVQAWAKVGSTITAIQGRDTMDLSKSKNIKIFVNTQIDKEVKVGKGWSLSNIHSMGTNIIYKGNGERVEKGVSSAKLSEGLIAYYRFDGNANDSSSESNHDGIASGVLYESGVVGQAAKFDGIDDSVLVHNADDFNINGDFSTSVWIKPNLNKSMMIFAKHNTHHSRSYNLDFGNNNIGFSIFASNDALHRKVIDFVYNVDEWMHISFVYNSKLGLINLYINGEKFLFDIGQLDIQQTTVPFSIGSYLRSSDGSIQRAYFSGLIDELRIYHKILKDEEVDTLYQYGLNGVSSYSYSGLNIRDNALEYEFNVYNKHIATKAYPSHTTLETYTYDSAGHVVAITD